MAPPHQRQRIQQQHSTQPEDAPSFGAWLRRQRRALDLTQAELAKQVSCARITIRRIEADELKPSQQLAELFAEQLGVPPTQRRSWLQFARGLAPMPQSHSIDLPATPLGPSTNLPASLTTFLGRNHEITDGCRLVTTSRLLTLTGVGGAGKTRLALEIGRTILDSSETDNPTSKIVNLKFPDDIWWVELAPLTDAALIPEAVAKVLGLREQPGQPLERLLLETLKTKHLLLLLDNCEHLVAGCATWVHQWLHHCPYLHILATSREPLQLMGEQRFPVAPLAAAAASELFVQRAQLVDPAFTRTVANGAAIDQLCQQVDYLPLAIELLAARSDLFTPQVMLERLQARPLDLLSAELRNLPPRQRTLRLTIQHSYDLLNEREQALFRTLGVFAGGFDQEAVAHWGFDENILQALIHKNLVQVQVFTHQEQRFFLMETLREFALERLTESKELQQIQGRHADFYVILVEEAELQHKGLQQILWLERLEREHDNLRIARQWSLRNNTETSLRLASSLAWFWNIRGYFQEGREWLEQILATNYEVSASFRAKAFYAAGILARRQGDYTAARRWFESSIALRREIGNHTSIAASLVNLANMQTADGHYEAACLLLQESLTIFRSLDDNGEVLIH